MLFSKSILKLITITNLFLVLAVSNAATANSSKNSELKPTAKQEQSIDLDSIIAIINDKALTSNELAQQVELAKKQFMHMNEQLPEPIALKKQVLDKMISQELQLQLAKRSGILIGEYQIENIIEKIARDNNFTVAELRQKVEQENISFEQYRENIRKELIISQLQQRDLINNLQVSEQEINTFLDSPNGLGNVTSEYRLAHILLELSANPSPDEIANIKDKADKLVAKLNNGTDFAKVASETSKGQTALNGGDLGWRKLAQIPTIFAKIVPSLKPGQVYTPIRSPSGYHIIKLIDKRKASLEQQEITKTNVRHILVKTNALTSDLQAKQLLADITDRINAKENPEEFSDLAKTYSEDLASSSNGGELGWVTNDVLVKEFSEVMNSLEIGEISKPFETSFGWHIVQVLDRKTEDDSVQKLRYQAIEMIKQRKFEEKLVNWQRDLKDSSYIKILDEDLA